MEQQKSKKGIMALIIGAGTFCVLLVLTSLVMFPYLVAKRAPVIPPVTKKYASDYHLDLKEREYKVLDKWTVSKENYDGTTYLYIYNPGSKDDAKSIDYLTFRVYDSSSKARKKFDKYYEECKNYSGIMEEGVNWFIAWEPGVCDASIKQLVFIEDSVIIYAELKVISEWGIAYDEPTAETAETTKPVFDRTTLKDYVLNHSEKIRDYVIYDILDY